MENGILFKNDLVSLVWNSSSLSLYDSDQILIDDFYYEDNDNINGLAKEIIGEIKDLSEDELCEWIRLSFNILEVKPHCGDEEIMNELREEYGSEWVCRVGDTALILKEM